MLHVCLVCVALRSWECGLGSLATLKHRWRGCFPCSCQVHALFVMSPRKAFLTEVCVCVANTIRLLKETIAPEGAKKTAEALNAIKAHTGSPAFFCLRVSAMSALTG